MVVDTLENLGLYLSLHEALAHVQDFLKKAHTLAQGRYDLDDGNFLIIREGETRDGSKALFEAHDRYIDFQVIAKGAERVEWAPRTSLLMTDPVDATKDIGFFRGTGDGIDIIAGMFYISFPQDAHKNNCHTVSIGSCDYRKYTFKLRSDQLRKG